jgi:hypothetical protein
MKITDNEKVLNGKAKKFVFDEACLRSVGNMPFSPFVAIKCNIKDSGLLGKLTCGKLAKTNLRSRLDLLVRQMDSSGFITRIFKGVEDGIYFICLGLSVEELHVEAQSVDYELKMNLVNTTLPYRDRFKKDLTPFCTKDIISLVINRFDRLFDIQTL